MQEVKLTPAQRSHMEALIARYTQRTQKSKQYQQTYHLPLADFRGISIFRMETKEMCYPIIGQSSRGSKIWDLDGNEYVDFSMGFGVNLLGHQPDFITAALEEQLKQGIQLGPQSDLAGEVAELIGELTGMPRVTFCNSGTEAVMTAVRIARAATGREKMALFANSYHGHSDTTLVVPGENFRGTSLQPGVLKKTVEESLVLPYGTPEALSTIKAHAHELAAVLVEPVQSRNPTLQPKEFLHELREITTASGIALIFDEVLTGFRAHLGGIQALFGVEADIVTYGKIVGGGMPIGLVTGRANYMDRIDGGMWQYGDASYPQVKRTFYAGTFCKHPLSMVVARAVLKHLKQQGPILQERLNERTSRLANQLNAYFKQNELPIRMVHFASGFGFFHPRTEGKIFEKRVPLEMELLYYHLVEKGFYIWEGRTCFLSTAHTDEELERYINAVKESIEELQAGGFSFSAK
ncbi:MAG: aspartate aminotransferase family protein [Candidatus Parabeggiatoa sp. nov. 1]|nr:MAG: aspartate aminotransferase family protein [Gammaproteobacteria bacterium]